FQDVVTAIDSRFRDQTLWMKLSEIARYWAAKELTEIKKTNGGYVLNAPFAAPAFTVKLAAPENRPPRLSAENKPLTLQEVTKKRDVKSGTWLREGNQTIVCFDLPKGASTLVV